ncbi:MAG: hypothetical protein M3Q06_01995, partial [Bacteroidota bacterium]|nr:hypothetical protein [Bacteroidota bacterium]
MKKTTWFVLTLCLPFIGFSQGVKTNQFDKFLKKQRIEIEPVPITGLPEKDKLSFDFTAIAADLFLNLSGTGWGATTVDKENALVLLFSNDSSLSLKAAALQSFEPGLAESAYRHRYNLTLQQLSALSRFDLIGLRKYSFDTYNELSLPAQNRDAIKRASALFLSELKKANITSSVREISVKDIRNYIGDSVSFCSQVFRTRFFKESEEGPTLLDVQANFSDPFVNVVILEKDRSKFNNAPEDVFLNKNVCISGVVGLRNNIPYLVVQNKDQIRMNSQLAEKNSAPSFASTPAEAQSGVEALAEFPGGANAFLNY